MRRQHVLTFIRYGVILLFAVSMLIPFFWMIISSFKDPVKVFERPINWWVDSFDFSNYTQFFTKYDGWHYIWNTVKLAASDALAPLEPEMVMVSLYVPTPSPVLGWTVNCAVPFGARMAVPLVKSVPAVMV